MDAGFLTSARGCFPGTTFPAILAQVNWIWATFAEVVGIGAVVSVTQTSMFGRAITAH